MLLAIDSGNTHVVFALYKNKKRLGHWRLQNDSHRPADEYIVFLNQWLNLSSHDLSEVTDVIIASVVPQTLSHLRNMVIKHLHITPLVIGEGTAKVDISVQIDYPHTLGADRLVNAFGALQLYDAPLLIIDFGTATTFDIVNDEGAYIGGVIAPGPQMSLRALVEGTAKLPPTPFERTEKIIGSTSVSAMQTGIYWGYVGLTEGLHQRICAEYKIKHGKKPLKVIVTGGLSGLFSKDLPFVDHVNETLTLDTLAEIHGLQK